MSVTSPGTADHPGAWLHISPKLLHFGCPYVGFVDLSVVNKKWFTSSDKHEVLSVWKGSVVLQWSENASGREKLLPEWSGRAV